ncbi:MAG: D-alanyl-D-alanine carboxypeptidase/D-alanyl-D-alanine-endopeptidase [Cypionkella sp.]|uniref:D-alanyl-D-alanine carboxypeptidase/D-alanyl-D-alanine endopeptidase n=1 Tax=Cypionkella sp. TaxID=2811411 RepID=UPI00260BCD5C|nr:D-alanyl-D-alanine carboxypeptidase/D-alanyl-D-alanine-endopeptidase [Cypionkella sp.]MDB5658430.1 D-alanyl-D-alanine carboxypeptidase/D-alanyl-D-alanine-endopeptidase [Cypionkella sp.]
MNVGRRWVLGGLLAGAALPAWADAPSISLRPRARPEPSAVGKPADKTAAGLVDAAKLTGVVGYCVADLATGRVLEASGEAVAMPAASVTKAVTTAFALEKLGVEHRFVTRIMRTGPVVSGRLDGDLILAGGGDPTFDTDKMGDLVAALAASGLREVTGKFIAYAGALPERDEIATDQPDFVGYNPAISGLMLNFNRVNFVWKAVNDGFSLTMNAEGARFAPVVTMASVQVVDRDVPVFAYEAGAAQDRWSVARGALGREGSRWLPVRHAGTYVAEVFQTLCAAQGIKLPKAEVVYTLPAAAEIVRHESEVLPDLLRKMMRFSTNLTAEAVGLTASGAGTLQGSAAVMTTWARRRFGIDTVFGDHSGLGPKTRISPAAMVQVMIRARADGRLSMLHDLMKTADLPSGDGKAAAKAAKAGSAKRVAAKSGTMNFVSNLSGYVDAPGGKSLAFAIFTADVPRRQAVPVWNRESPEGDRAWVKRAHRLQGQLLNRWGAAYL